MDINHILGQLKELTVYGMAGCYETQLNPADHQESDSHALVVIMVKGEAINSIPLHTCDTCS